MLICCTLAICNRVLYSCVYAYVRTFRVFAWRLYSLLSAKRQMLEQTLDFQRSKSERKPSNHKVKQPGRAQAPVVKPGRAQAQAPVVRRLARGDRLLINDTL